MYQDLEVLLYPGEYRVSITTYNVLGKKASSTDWVEFTILDESEPFIFENAFTASKKYDVPVMNFKLEDDYIVYSSENTVSAIDDYIDNSFFLTGKNFFFPETKFYLLPKAKSVNGLQGEPFVEGRIKSELSILRRDRERRARRHDAAEGLLRDRPRVEGGGTQELLLPSELPLQPQLLPDRA